MKSSKESLKPMGEVEYICPMRCEPDKIYTNPGKCPFCNMNLVRVDKNKNMHRK